MIIEIHKPELENLIRDQMASGKFQNVEDVLIQALKSSPTHDPITVSAQKPKMPVGKFLLESPLRDSGLKLERQKDYPRPIDL